ncbi:MAG: hypothetical protein AB2689_01885 [Candidatus Thiodiazotropha taylori]
MHLLDENGLIILIAVFGLAMLAITIVFGRGLGHHSIDGFILANRDVPWWLGGPSVAASWTWAIALMVSVQLAYQNGLAGAFWFIAPNICAVLIFVWLAPKLRKALPQGYSLPEWMLYRTGSKGVVAIYLIVFGFYQVMAVTVQIYAGGHLLSAATGVSVQYLMPALLVITLSYTLLSGLQASIVTDLVQLVVLLLIAGATIAIVLASGSALLDLNGVTSSGGINPFDPSFALTVGLITTIGLMSGAIGDQQLWQRALALRSGDVRKGFLFGAMLFALIPTGLSLIGFYASGMHGSLIFPQGIDEGMVGFVVVQQVAPAAIAIAFLMMILAGLSSTLDSGLMAWVSLAAMIRQKLWQTAPTALTEHHLSVKASRFHMLVLAAIGLILGYAVESIPGFSLKYLWWFMNTMGASVAVPTLLSLTWQRLTGRGVIVGSGINLVVGLPVVAYASATENNTLLAVTYSLILAISALSCYAFRSRTNTSLASNR